MEEIMMRERMREVIPMTLATPRIRATQSVHQLQRKCSSAPTLELLANTLFRETVT